MLAKILALINEGRLQNRQALATELGVSESMLSMMIEQLIGLGYLEEMGPNSRNCDASGNCQVCSLKEGCMLLNSRQPSTLLITAKGMKQLEKA
ncbi:MAG TPA: FeoC-like transcriptional regulator [Longilinea sp.]|nr:FeoC-like transcriptional regulator [Longilinea sp.]